VLNDEQACHHCKLKPLYGPTGWAGTIWLASREAEGGDQLWQHSSLELCAASERLIAISHFELVTRTKTPPSFLILRELTGRYSLQARGGKHEDDARRISWTRETKKSALHIGNAFTHPPSMDLRPNEWCWSMVECCQGSQDPRQAKARKATGVQVRVPRSGPRSEVLGAWL